MKANEMRVGNYYDHNGEVKQVTPNTILEVWEAERDWCKPIPLSEEVLIRCGFEKNKNEDRSDCFYFISVGVSQLHINPDNGVAWIFRGDNIFNNPTLIEYLHQLQNLYFALTGEEIVLKDL